MTDPATDAPTPEAAAREAVWDYLRDYPDCSITWTESAYIAQLAVEAWKSATAAASTIPVSLPDGSTASEPTYKWPSTTGSTDDR